jgi:hypothetical protein
MSTHNGNQFLQLLVETRGPTRVIRISNLIKHEKQREVSMDAVQRAFESWGANILPEKNVLHVMSLTNEIVPGDLKKVLPAPEGQKFYILDGQHRIEVLRMAIELEIAEEQRLRGSPTTEITREEVEAHPRASWPAVIYNRGEQQHVEHNDLTWN